MKTMICIALLVMSSAKASEILNCHQRASSNITFESKNTFESDSKLKSDKKYKITFVINKKDALLKGNAGNGIKLFKANSDTFLENTGINIILWKLIRSPENKNISYLIQAKAYNSFGPVTYTTIWECT